MEWLEKNLQENFDLPAKHPSEEALRRWRSAVSVVRNPRRRFRMVADLVSRSQNEARRRSIQENFRNFRVAVYVHQAAVNFIDGAKNKEYRLTEDIINAGFSINPDELASITGKHDMKSLRMHGGVDGISKKICSTFDRGISASDLDTRQNIYGVNRYPEKPSRSFWMFVWDALQDMTLIILMVCALISAVVGLASEGFPKGMYDGLGIILSILLVVMVTAISDYRQSLQFKELDNEKKKIFIHVTRDGSRQKISIYDLVVGEIVHLSIGDQVPADGLYIHGYSLLIDESSLSGESDPVYISQDKPFILAGTKVQDGSAKMMVTAVGMRTEWGRLMSTLSEGGEDETPLQVKLNGVATIIGKIGLVFATLTFLVLMVRFLIEKGLTVGLSKWYSTDALTIVNYFATAVTIIVVAVPEGLPLAVTMSLAFAMKKLMNDKALVRHLSACETMGSAGTICTDKTGTLTTNHMVVDKIWISEVSKSVTGNNTLEDLNSVIFPTTLGLLLQGIFENTSAEVVKEKDGTQTVLGTPTERAIFQFGLKLEGGHNAEDRTCTKVKVEPFNSVKKKMAVLVSLPNGTYRWFSKGASEIIVQMCDMMVEADGNSVPMSESQRKNILDTINSFASDALRTLCLAYKEVDDFDDGSDSPTSGFTLISIFGIKDPVRPGVKDAVKACMSAGIIVRMVTGDNINTAKAIAKECGILTDDGIAIEGPDFRSKSPEEMRDLIPNIRVMARLLPLDKHTLVTNLRGMFHEVVAVTGDGTNDAPALHEADIGLAMGIAGTEAFEYKRLLLDYNREVRRATHEAMSSLVIAIKKGIAPHLKSLMGPWWFSQFDPAPEVAQAARRSFEAAFPQSERRLDALMLCVKEIFLYLSDNLKLTAQALSDKVTPMDELEDMHQRVISSSLLAMATLIDILLGVKLQNCDVDSTSTEKRSLSKVRSNTLSSAEAAFCMHKCFLDVLKSKSAVIRSATYSLLTSYIKHVPHVFDEETMKKLSPTILGAFHEKDASCHSSMWDTILVFSRKFPEAWSYCNIHKVVLSRFWNFLQNGCYGSKQISYPRLVQFLDSIPPKAVMGQQFVFDFLHNLWDGRNQRQLSAADSLAFCIAFKHIFLWLLENVSRYSGEDSSDDTPIKLITDILAKIVWRDYLLLSGDTAGSGVQLSHKNSGSVMNTQYPMYYLQDLGKCIVEIVDVIADTENHLLNISCSLLVRDCMDIIQQGEKLSKFQDHVEQLVSFFLSLDQLVVHKGKTWPLERLARPLVEQSLPAIMLMDTPSLVNLLSVLVEIFGPFPLFLKNYQNYHGKSDVKSYLELFNSELLPWCFNGKYNTCNSKIDLLLSLFQNECFFDQWCSIIKYTRAEQKHSIDDKTLNIKSRLELLTLLLQKVRERIAGGKLRNLQKNGYLPEHWRHDLLDSTATSVLCDLTAADHHVSFLCAALGGSDQDDQICFLSAETVHKVLESIVKDLASALLASSFEWARLAYSLLLPSEPEHLKLPEENPLLINFETARFAFKVLQGSFFSLGRLEEDSVFPSILAALFVIEWECSMSLATDDESDLEGHIKDMEVGSSMGRSSKDYLDEKMHLKANLAESIHAFCQSLSPSFWNNLPSCTVNRLANILAQTVRYSVFETRELHVEKTAVLCSEWVVKMLKLICLDDINLQSFFDLLLSEGEYWPLWLKPCLQNGLASMKVQLDPAIADDIELKHEQFVAFVDRLILNLGFGEVILGIPENLRCATSQSIDITSPMSSLSRAWVAGEILCTWTWKGGSALKTFLPSLVQYIKEESRLEVNIVSLLLDTLLGGTLMHESDSWVLFNAWHLSNNEIGKIQDRFLRALVALLFTTNTKNCLWRESDALVFFEQVLSNLFMGSTVNRKCLKVLPFVMSTIIKPLPQKQKFIEDSPYGDLVRKSILSWLEAAISCLSSSPREVPVQDIEDWMQVALSCFPLSITGGAQRLVVTVEREISDAEISLMLTLFQKYQFFYNGAASSLSTSETVIPRTVELLGVKLTAVMVGYCWTKLQENDWHFVFRMVFKCIESSSLLVEEMTDGINDAVINQLSSEDALEKLKLMVSTTDKLTLSLAEASLVTLCHLNHLGNLQEVETAKSLQLIRSGDYAESTNKMMESILRLFLATGVSEAIAKSFGEEASSIIGSSRHAYLHFWELVVSFIKNASPEIRRSALESMDLWGLTKGSVSGLYSILFSSQPIFHLQFAAFSLLLSEPFCQLSLLKDSSLGENCSSAQRSDISQSTELMPDSEKTLCLRDELSALVEFPTSELLKTDLTARDRVDVFIAWALLLSHLQSLPSSSIIRENVLQYIQEKISPCILDCIFQHIPVKSAAPSGKKKDAELLPEAEAAAKASKDAIVTCSLLPYVESLSPVGTLQMASLAGSLYGMMIRLLPSFVRTWFTTLRDRSLSYSIESFTRQWCSPPLLLDEFSQVKDSVYADENFSVSVNRSAYEIIATYKKEDTGIDLVIRLPNCYPLRHVDVECTRSLGISEVKCRKWLLSLTSFVRNQNGAIAEAIRTWKSNFDKEFEGVEECPICYSILHTSNHSLPRLACKTCKHKFHGACLYKWFSTSNKSTCPLCQTPF